jgi:hypothetical protein
MSKTIHLGAFVNDVDSSRLPNRVTSDGDSFIEWGESPRNGDPIHLTVDAASVGTLNHATISAQEQLAFRPASTNTLDGANVLSIVVEFDVAAVLGTDAGPLLAVVGETLTSAGRPVRLERMGRAEIKNVIMRPKAFDPVNRDLEIRDLYNDEDPFDLRPDYVDAYRARLNANLAFFDRLDGRIDWPVERARQPPVDRTAVGRLPRRRRGGTVRGRWRQRPRDRAGLARRPATHHLRRPITLARHHRHALHDAGRWPGRTQDQRRPRSGDTGTRPHLPLPDRPQPGPTGHPGPARRASAAAGTRCGVMTGLTGRRPNKRPAGQRRPTSVEASS